MNNFKWSDSLTGKFLFLTAMVLFLLQTGISNSFAENLVRKAQASMLVLGINAGPVDGIWGPRTQRGVWAFQEMEGLAITGKLDAPTTSLLFAKKNAILSGKNPDEIIMAPEKSGGEKLTEEPAKEKMAEQSAEKAPEAPPVAVTQAGESKESAPPVPEKVPASPPEPKAATSPPEPKAAAETPSATMASSQLPPGLKITGKYEEETVSNGGSISGVVNFSGNVPAPIMEDLSKGKNVEFCGGHPDAKDNIRPRVKVAVANGKLKDAVVFIYNIEKGKAWSAEVNNFDFRNCDIFPKVSVIRKTPKGVKEGLFTITNQDPDILHNPHGYSVVGASRKTLFNKPLPTKGTVADVTKSFKRFKPNKDKHFFLQCDQHNFMEADARVVWNPYYSISQVDGSFKIDQIPAGKYWVTVWHPYLGKASVEVTISGGKDEKVDFILTS